MKLQVDSASFVEPSKIRTLVVPIGKWRRNEFLEAVEKLRKYSEIRLLDITPIESSLFTPQGFPSGRLFFTFSTSGYNDSLNLFLYDFEPFRKVFVVIGLVNDQSDPEVNLKALQERYPTIISHNLIVVSEAAVSSVNNNVFSSGPRLEERLETILCDIGKNFLQALSHYYSSYKHMTLRSPGAIGGNSVLKTNLTRQVAGLAAIVSPTSGNASKRLSSIEITTNNIKRSASLKLAKSLSTTENRSQSRSRGRQLKILGNFQLLAGRYTDALSSFTEAITLLHKIRDHLWLGSALDGIAICIVLLSYLQISFQIPPIINVLCPHHVSNALPETDSPRNSVSHTPMKSPRDSTSSLSSVAAIDAESANLPKLIKSISEKIMYYYELSLSHTTDYAPQMVYSEILLKTLSFMVCCRSSSALSSDDLQLVIESALPEPSQVRNSNLELAFTSSEIYSFSNRLFDLQLKDMNVESQCDIYIHLAQIYDSLGFERKRAFVLRLLLVAVASGAANIQSFPHCQLPLQDMVRLYGIEDSRHATSSEDVSWLTLQKGCLQLCLTVASKVGDKKLSAHYALLLIRNYTHLLTQSEQVSLFTNHIQSLILDGFIESYWDPYLLRDLKFARLESSGSTFDGDEIPVESQLTLSEKSNGEVSKLDTYQVFNPFRTVQAASKKSEVNTIQGTFLVGDKAMVTCMVQNPFKFEIGITQLSFNDETMKYIELDENEISLKAPIFISPESTRLVNLPIKFKTLIKDTVLTITSLKVSVMGMPSQEFAITSSESTIKGHQETEVSTEGHESVKIKIIPQQPELQQLRTENIANNSWMMLHGTKRTISVVLRNKSLCCPIDRLQFSHITNIEKSMKADYWKKLPYDDLYGVEKQLEMLRKSCIRILNPPSKMGPNEVVTVDVEIDATSVPLQFDGFDLLVKYGMRTGDDSRMYMKSLCFSYEVSLKRSIEVSGLEIVPLNELFSPKMEKVDWIEYLMREKHANPEFRVGDYVLLLLDIRNSWIDGVRVDLSFKEFHSQKHLVESDHTIRVIVPIKRIKHEATPFRARTIPRVFKDRQYIQSGLNEEQERDMREKFWCREYILSNLRCQWHLSKDPNVGGRVDFRHFLDKFEDPMVSSVYADRLPYLVDLRVDKNEVEKNSPVQAKVTITSTHSKQVKPEPLILTFLVFDNQTSQLLPKSSRRILYNGTLTRHVIASHESQVVLELVPIESGSYEICALLTKPNEDRSMSLFNREPVSFQVS